jgi:hypothetical protein
LFLSSSNFFLSLSLSLPIRLTSSIQLIEAPIEIVIPLNDKTCAEGTSEFAEFIVELNKEKVNLIWKCDDEPIDFTHPKYSVVNDKTKYTLIIRNIELTDEKMYSCQVGSGTSSRVKCSAQLTVDELPPEFVLTSTPLKDRDCFEEDDVEFECELNKSKWRKTGQPIVCKWFRNVDRELRTTAKYSIERSGPMQKLIIHNAQFEDEAEYRCVILEQFIAAKLTVNGNYRFCLLLSFVIERSIDLSFQRTRSCSYT